jgi:chromosome segregation ATPase
MLNPMRKEKEAPAQPGLFGQRDELISAINIEMADLAERTEAIAKRIEAAERQRDDLDGRLRNLRGILAELQKPCQPMKKEG